MNWAQKTSNSYSGQASSLDMTVKEGEKRREQTDRDKGKEG